MEKNEALMITEKSTPDFPVLVEAEKMFEKLAAITKETAARAYDFFLERGSQFGNQVEDWLRAESEMLRTAPVKITDSNGKLIVTIAVPGFKRDEIEVSIKDDILIVSGETSAEEKKEDEQTLYSEWTSDRFLRELSLPYPVDEANVDAKMKDGILTLILNKQAEATAAKIAVKSA